MRGSGRSGAETSTWRRSAVWNAIALAGSAAFTILKVNCPPAARTWAF
jgi:hypothetical protein